MAEVALALVAGAFWLSAFAVVALHTWRLLPASVGPALLAAYAVFFALQVIVAKALGAFGLLTTPILLVVYAIAVVGGVIAYLRLSRGVLQDRLRLKATTAYDPDVTLLRRLVGGTVGIVLLGLLVFALVAPVHIWDVLAYHMPMVAAYVQQGSLEPWATQDLRQVMRVNAGELQLLSMALLSGSDVLMELPGILALAVSLVASFELARLVLGSRPLAYAVVAVMLSAPQVLLAATTAKNDLVFTAVLLSAFYWVIRSGKETEGRPGLALALAALSGALAAATKVLGLNVLAAAGLLVVVLTVRKRLRWGHTLMFGLAAVGLLLVFAGDIFWRNVGAAPVPVGVTSSEIYFTVGLANLTEAARYYVYDLGVRRLLAPQVFEHDFGHYGYLYPLLLVFGVAGAVRVLRDRRYGPAALLVASAALFLSIIAFRQPIQWDQRFMLWIIPVLAILSLSLVRSSSPRVMLVMVTAALTLGLTNLATIITQEFDHLFGRSASHLVATGEPARYVDVPNRRYLGRIDGFESLERAAEPEDSVLYVGSGNTWMYPAWGPRFTRHVEGVDDAAHAEEQVDRRAFRFIVLESSALRDVRASVEAATDRSRYETLQIAEGRTVFIRRDDGRPGDPDGVAPD